MSTSALTRRAFLGGAGALGAGAILSLAACSSDSGDAAGPAASGEALPVSLGFSKNVEFGGLWIADHSGYYAAEGIAPTFDAGGPNTPAPEVLLSTGTSAIGVEANFIRMFEYLSQHDDVVLIGAQFQTAPTGLLSLAERPVRTVDDLHGTTVLAAAGARSNVEALMKRNDISDYTFVTAGTDVGPLLAGQGDALWSFSTNQPITIEQEFGLEAGSDYHFTFLSDFNFYAYSDLYLTSREFLESNRAQVVSFMRASVQGWQDFIADPDEGAVLAVEEYGSALGLDLAQQKAVAQTMVPLLQSDFTRSNGLLRIDKDFLQDKVYPSVAAAGLLNLPEVDDIVDSTVLDEVFADGVTI